MSQIDPEIVDVFRKVCTKPAMFVGVRNYEKAMIWMDAFVIGRQTAGKEMSSFHRGMIHGDFRCFLADRLNKGKSLVWWMVPTKLRAWNDLREEEKLALMLKEFEEFVNPLTRLASELQ